MKQSDAEGRALILWDEWPHRSSPATHPEKRLFFLHLERHHPDLLNVRVGHGQDKWQVLQAWLSNR
jgi:hypothetical protein